MAIFIELWPCLFTTKLSYVQLFKWGHSTTTQVPTLQWLYSKYKIWYKGTKTCNKRIFHLFLDDSHNESLILFATFNCHTYLHNYMCISDRGCKGYTQLGSQTKWPKHTPFLLMHSRNARNLYDSKINRFFEIEWTLFEIILFIHFYPLK